MSLFYIIIFVIFIVIVSLIIYFLTYRQNDGDIQVKLHNKWVKKYKKKTRPAIRSSSSSSRLIRRFRKKGKSPSSQSCNSCFKMVNSEEDIDEECQMVAEKDYLLLEVIKNKKNIRAYTNTQLDCNSYRTELDFTYCSPKKHKALYLLKDVRGILSRVTNGIVLINRNGKHEEMYNYISSYNKEEKIMYITVLDYDEIVELCGCVKIKIIMCEGKNINTKDKDTYKHPGDERCGMCR
ncbi:MAG TPA: hypothetical protein PK891_04695 [Bacteroidales bacterium]|nr:hypothetical protein [Bacteroidales bacterium]